MTRVTTKMVTNGNKDNVFWVGEDACVGEQPDSNQKVAS